VAKLPSHPRGRHHEITRQWEIIRTLEHATYGKSIRALAEQAGVTQRTVRRDLEVLEAAGFALEQKIIAGEKRWRLDRRSFSGLLERGLSVSELCALYLSRAFVESFAGAPFREDLRSAFDKIEDALPRKLWRYVERLPSALAAKTEPAKIRGDNVPGYLTRLTDAVLEHKRVHMRYESFSSRAVKEYTVDPHRLLYGQGGIYLHAYVPIYGDMRTFAVERIRHLEVRRETFEPHGELEADVFPHSMGVYSGRPERVELEFTPELAPYILERQWHRTQVVERRPDNSVRLQLHVSVDWALRHWILSFGGGVRVIEPRRLAEQVLVEIEEARRQYAPRFDFDEPESPPAPVSPAQRRLLRVK
jgi:predicted DNA-binding transcriptional regulator YafY